MGGHSWVARIFRLHLQFFMQIPRTIIADADDDCLLHNCNHKFACSQNLNCGRRLLEISLSKVFPPARVFLIFPYHCIFVFLYFSPALDTALKVRSKGKEAVPGPPFNFHYICQSRSRSRSRSCCYRCLFVCSVISIRVRLSPLCFA